MMGQEEVIRILKQSPNKFISVSDLAKILNQKPRNIYPVLKRLEKNQEFTFKIQTVNGKPSRFYAYSPLSSFYMDTLAKYQELRKILENHVSGERVATFMLLEEIKNLKEEIKNGK